MSPNPILLKIKKLLNMTTARGATEAEATNAMRMANDLMAKHKLSMAEVDAHNPEAKNARKASEARFTFQKKTFYRWEKRLVSVVARLCDVEALLGWRGPVFIGVESEAQIAVEMYGYLHATALKLRADYAKTRPGERDQVGGALWDESYMAGLMSRLYERAMDIADSARKKEEANTSVTALVVCNKALVSRYVMETYQNLRRSSSRSHSVHSPVYGAGHKDGAKVSLRTSKILK